MKMDPDKIKEKIKIAQKAVEGMDEPLKTKTYEIVLNKLLAEEENKVKPMLEEKENVYDYKNEFFPITEGNTLTSRIINLLSSEWGKIPRTLDEIRVVLANNGFHYPPSTISPALFKLTRKGVLRRLKKDKIYSYVLARR